MPSYMIYLYRLLYFILKTWVGIFHAFLPEKFDSWIELRHRKPLLKKDFKNTYWFHAASGEIEYCKPVIRLLKANNPEAQIVVTYSSPSAEKLFHNIKPLVDAFIPLCWDSPHQIAALIEQLNPRTLIFSRTDLWPELIYQAKLKNIKTGVISFNPSFHFLSRIILKFVLPQLDFISCVDSKIKFDLESLTQHKAISVDGDTRYDQVFYRLSQNSKLELKSSSKIFICGSTWPEDETELIKCLPQLVKNEQFKIILSPHEVQNQYILRIEKELDQIGLSHQRLSKEKDLHDIHFTQDVFIIDQIGYLADAYRFADVAFVGGSYKEKIHSVMEPLCCGLPVVTGPYFKNNPEAVKYHNRYVFSALSSIELVEKLRLLMNVTKAEIRNEMKKNQNASERVLKLI